MNTKIKFLEWESDFFNLNIAQLEFDTKAPLFSVKNLFLYDLIQAKIPSHDIELIQYLYRFEFQLVESEVDFILPVLAEYQISFNNSFSRIATELDIIEIKLLVSNAFKYSRFRPPWYKIDDGDKLYSLWSEKAILGTFDDQCLLIEDENCNLQGIVTIRATSFDTGRIGLLAVSPSAQGKGIGSRLVKMAQVWCFNKDIKYLNVATQLSNIPALNLYTHNGANIINTAYWLYR